MLDGFGRPVRGAFCRLRHFRPDGTTGAGDAMTDRIERMLNKYGVAVVIALFLVWWMTTDISGRIGRMDDQLGDHVKETNFYLRQVCLNTAQTEAERAGCIPR